TYMRTDSLHLANSAVDQARKVIEQEYGKKYLPAKPVVYKTKSKGAQEAHEAIRPTFLQKKPEELESALSPEQFKLYELIYKRTLACQMAAAVFGQTTVVIGGQNEQAKQVKEAKFRVTGSVLKFPGFLAVYDETREEDSQSEDEDGKIFLPPLQAEEKLDLTKLLPEQHFTQPPARYSEATLVKALEEHGIGRPSTYAPIIGTIRDRGYVRMEKKRFVPEDVGMVVNDLLVEHFPEIVDIDFTASLEEKLDQIASGQKKWVPVIADFYKPFSELLEIKTKEVKKRDVTVEETDETCDLCGKPMLIRLGKYGKFMACSGYPECKNTRQIVKAGQEESESEIPPEQERSEACEQCGGKMILKKGRYGQFWGCGNYPECKNIQPLHKAKEIGVQCPDCGAEIVVKRTRRGKIFYGCSGYPKCKYASWTKPGE
ncbi:MAG TPA: DNA topoisomerase I, partial [Candidatus Wirthbacteria bacterium]|nr:DNA topoisomerase I [Candidatus Wirthbacteria bacterium]